MSSLRRDILIQEVEFLRWTHTLSRTRTSTRAGVWLTLLFWPDQCTMAWLWDESPVRANVELLSFKSSCRAPAALRSSPLQRAALRPAAAAPSAGAELTASPPLSLLKRRGVEPTPSLCWETFPLSVIRSRLSCACCPRSGAQPAGPGSQGTLPVRSPLPKTSPITPAAGPLVSTLSSNSCAPYHIFPSRHDLQVISASATPTKPRRRKKSPNRSAPCHFGQNLTSVSIAGGRTGCSGCWESVCLSGRFWARCGRETAASCGVGAKCGGVQSATEPKWSKLKDLTKWSPARRGRSCIHSEMENNVALSVCLSVCYFPPYGPAALKLSDFLCLTFLPSHFRRAIFGNCSNYLFVSPVAAF